MSKIMHIWPNGKKVDNGKINISAIYEFPDGSKEEIWYKIPLERENEITDITDPFVIGSIFFAMMQKINIKIHGSVSESLLENLDEYQAIWQCWKPSIYKKVNIFASDEITQTNFLKSGTIIPFSGGVDSCFSVFRHANNMCGRRNKSIEAAIMVHGFDIPLIENDVYLRAVKKAENILNFINIPLIQVSTNWRTIQRKYNLIWDECFGTAVISVLSLFQERYANGLISSQLTYQSIKNGSNPLTDPYLSSENFKIIHDEAQFTRIEKVEYISNWDVVNTNLRVCWQGIDHDRNCGKCEKCVRTILNYRAIGKDLPKCFENDINDSLILSIKIQNEHAYELLKSIYDYSISRNLSKKSWVKALEKRIQRYKNPKFTPKFIKKISYLKKRFLD